MVTKTPWAILLCKLAGDAAEPLPRRRYEEIFTQVGSGSWNMPDFFRDMSHGQLDLSGSEVFGWYQLDQPYSGSGANQQGRQDLIAWAREKAFADGVDLSKFFSVVVVLNQPADLFGGSSGAVSGCDSVNRAVSNLSPAYMGQEMGHVYGLAHSRAEGSTADYTDPFDVMSNLTDRSTPHPVFDERDPVDGAPVYRIGPGLNAANMWSRDWLDMTRLWSSLSGPVSTIVKLRPLHRRDLDGYLAIRFGSYFIEYRTGRGWDAALDPCVLVHRFVDNHSYLVSDDNGKQQFVAGSTLSSPSQTSVLGSGYAIRVDNIDDEEQTAVVSLVRTAPQIDREWPKHRPFRTPWIAWLDDHDLAVVIEGRAIAIPATSPMHELVRRAALVVETSTLPLSSNVRDAVRQDAIRGIGTLASAQLARLTEPQSPALHPVGRVPR